LAFSATVATVDLLSAVGRFAVLLCLEPLERDPLRDRVLEVDPLRDRVLEVEPLREPLLELLLRELDEREFRVLVWAMEGLLALTTPSFLRGFQPSALPRRASDQHRSGHFIRQADASGKRSDHPKQR
jgi:hypothetical protein